MRGEADYGFNSITQIIRPCQGNRNSFVVKLVSLEELKKRFERELLREGSGTPEFCLRASVSSSLFMSAAGTERTSSGFSGTAPDASVVAGSVTVSSREAERAVAVRGGAAEDADGVVVRMYVPSAGADGADTVRGRIAVDTIAHRRSPFRFCHLVLNIAVS